MQGYSYSIFSGVAIAIHLIINFGLLAGRGIATARGRRYRGFLFAVLVYYVADAAWGVFAGLGWNRVLYADTIIFFLSLPVFVFMWGRFAAAYLRLGKLSSRILAWAGAAMIAISVELVAANFFDGRVFYFEESGKYCFGDRRYISFVLLIAFNALTSAFAIAKALTGKNLERRRGMMIAMFGVAVAVSIVLQIVWPLTPFTALGCLVCNCFFHVFVIQDEQSARHMAKLEDALERARAADKARSMFFSVVSHDIRTPLNAILGYAELLQSGIENPSKRDEALDSIRASGTTLLELVNDVLDLAKMDSGKMAFRPESVRLDRLVGDVFASFRMAAAKKGVALIDRTAGVPALMLDEHRFRQMLFNLVGNAVKFTDRGSVAVSASYSGGELVLAVADTGCGIAPDMLTRVLDPFVQVQDPSHASDRAGGTGLGLSICRSFAEAMGGKLSVESELGKGSVFSIRVPGVETAKEEPVKEPRRTAAVAPAGGDGRRKVERVLVVDDSPVNRAVIAAHLKKAGIVAIDSACDGVEALAKLDEARRSGEAFDMVFTDFWMPNMNGAELIAKIRSVPEFSHLPVFAVTADIEYRHDERFKLFDGVLMKPLTAGKLAAALDEARSANMV